VVSAAKTTPRAPSGTGAAGSADVERVLRRLAQQGGPTDHQRRLLADLDAALAREPRDDGAVHDANALRAGTDYLAEEEPTSATPVLGGSKDSTRADRDVFLSRCRDVTVGVAREGLAIGRVAVAAPAVFARSATAYGALVANAVVDVAASVAAQTLRAQGYDGEDTARVDRAVRRSIRATCWLTAGALGAGTGALVSAALLLTLPVEAVLGYREGPRALVPAPASADPTNDARPGVDVALFDALPKGATVRVRVGL